ncbi:integrase core domain-containing protein [Xanthomonas phaseoli]|uniref:integrase core domain-containing protein n=1 Tax=Xanthomonas phaseoli TaxID=1985254 RepID=UPI0023E35595|nr:transposase [Xanthomonas phaseoli]
MIIQGCLTWVCDDSQANKKKALGSGSARGFCLAQGRGIGTQRGGGCKAEGQVRLESRPAPRFPRPLRDECLNEHRFPTLLHARTAIERWRREYNKDRPKKAIGVMTPAAYAQHLANSDIINHRLQTRLLLRMRGRRWLCSPV